MARKNPEDYKAFAEKHPVGTQVTCTFLSFIPNGFCLFKLADGVTTVLGPSDLASDPKERASLLKNLSEGDFLECVVTGYRLETRFPTVDVSRTALKPDPWQEHAANLRRGDRLSLPVLEVDDEAKVVWLDLGGLSASLPFHELAWRPAEPPVPEVGDTLDVVVTRLDKSKKEVRVSRRLRQGPRPTAMRWFTNDGDEALPEQDEPRERFLGLARWVTPDASFDDERAFRRELYLDLADFGFDTVSAPELSDDELAPRPRESLVAWGFQDHVGSLFALGTDTDPTVLAALDAIGWRSLFFLNASDNPDDTHWPLVTLLAYFQAVPNVDFLVDNWVKGWNPGGDPPSREELERLFALRPEPLANPGKPSATDSNERHPFDRRITRSTSFLYSD